MTQEELIEYAEEIVIRGRNGLSKEGYEEYKKTQIEIYKSEENITRLIKEIKDYGDLDTKIDILEKQIELLEKGAI